jgi:quercetin dioxygenase-like cupin family protein
MSRGRPEAPQVIENPLSGERIVIAGPPGNGHGTLAWDLYLSPGGRVPNSHLHPSQEERFHVRAGRVRFRVDGRRVLAGPGDIVRVPAGTAHHFANAGPGAAWARVETWPAFNMVAMFEAAAEMARQQRAAGRALPRVTDLVLFMREFEAEVASPYLPRLVRTLVRVVAPLVSGPSRARHLRRERTARLGLRPR